MRRWLPTGLAALILAAACAAQPTDTTAAVTTTRRVTPTTLATTTTGTSPPPSPTTTAIPPPPDSPVVRITADLTVASPGPSEPLAFDIEPGTALVSVLARTSDPATHIQIERFVLAGSDVAGTNGDDLASMEDRFLDHEVIETSTGFVHEVRRSHLTFSYPFAPGWDLPPGPASISFLVDRPDTIGVEVVVQPAGARRRLDVDVFQPGEARLSAPARAEASRIYAEAGITLAWHDRPSAGGSESTVAELGDGGPGSPMFDLAGIAAGHPAGVNVIVVDGLPGGLSGYATGVPGPHDGSGAAVVRTVRSAVETGRLVAHEIGHLLGLRHLEDRSARGRVISNPITDTEGDAFNLMQFGTHLTEGQIEILRLSPLLSTDP